MGFSTVKDDRHLDTPKLYLSSAIISGDVSHPGGANLGSQPMGFHRVGWRMTGFLALCGRKFRWIFWDVNLFGVKLVVVVSKPKKQIMDFPGNFW